METGLKFGSDGDAATAAALRAIKYEAKARTDEKAAKKAAFDSEYDDGTLCQHTCSLPSQHSVGSHICIDSFAPQSLRSHAVAAGGSKAVKDKSKEGTEPAEKEGDEEEEETYYDAIRREMAARALKTSAALDALDPQQRIAMEGFRPGTYLRLCFKGKRPSTPKECARRHRILISTLFFCRVEGGCTPVRQPWGCKFQLITCVNQIGHC